MNKDENTIQFLNKIDKNRSGISDFNSQYDNNTCNKIETTMMGGIEVSKLSPRSEDN